MGWTTLRCRSPRLSAATTVAQRRQLKVPSSYSSFFPPGCPALAAVREFSVLADIINSRATVTVIAIARYGHLGWVDNFPSYYIFLHKVSRMRSGHPVLITRALPKFVNKLRKLQANRIGFINYNTSKRNLKKESFRVLFNRKSEQIAVLHTVVLITLVRNSPFWGQGWLFWVGQSGSCCGKISSKKKGYASRSHS